MKKLIYIGIIAVSFIACATYQKPLVDDAYYWPEKQEIRSSEPIQPSQSTQPRQSSQIQYLNVQDTTVTIRIKR